jgi:hypothetical protein
MNEGNSDSVLLVSVGLPSRETARGFCSARKSFTCSSWEWKRTPLWAGVAGALLEELKPTESVIIVREPRAGVRFALRDDLRGSPDFCLGNRGMGSHHAIAAAARGWTCDSDKQYDSRTLSGQCANGVSSLKSTIAGVGIDCSVGRTAGKRWSRTRRGGAG